MWKRGTSLERWELTRKPECCSSGYGMPFSVCLKAAAFLGLEMAGKLNLFSREAGWKGSMGLSLF
jgi:hypothetical protein